MILEAAVAMLACARIGAVHSVVFGGFSPEALRGRIEDCGSRIVVTADGGARGGKLVPLKANVDAALQGGPAVDAALVLRHCRNDVALLEVRDRWYHNVAADLQGYFHCAPMSAAAKRFIISTSVSSGTPDRKRVVEGRGVTDSSN